MKRVPKRSIEAVRAADESERERLAASAYRVGDLVRSRANTGTVYEVRTVDSKGRPTTVTVQGSDHVYSLNNDEQRLLYPAHLWPEYPDPPKAKPMSERVKP